MSTPIKGENGILYVYDEQASAYKPIACLTSNSINSTIEAIDSQTKCAPGVTVKSAGVFAYSVSLEGEYIDTTSVGGDTTKKSHDALLALQLNKQLLNWKIDTDITDGDSIKYYGEALLTDLTLDQATNENSTFSGTLDGSGLILTEDPMDGGEGGEGL